MKEFDFDVTQVAETYFKSTISIQAKSKKEAIAKLKQMSNSEIEELCDCWELADEATPNGNIEIWDNGKLI